MSKKINPKDIHDAMVINPHHNLWNKELAKWNESDRETFKLLLNEKIVSRLKKREDKIVLRKKVIRISDGYIYNSISECRFKNKFHKVKMDTMIKEENQFKLYKT